MAEQTQHRPIIAYAGRSAQREVYLDRDGSRGGGIRVHINRSSGLSTDSITIPTDEVPELLLQIREIAGLLGVAESEATR